jgi:hypothetical protein
MPDCTCYPIVAVPYLDGSVYPLLHGQVGGGGPALGLVQATALRLMGGHATRHTPTEGVMEGRGRGEGAMGMFMKPRTITMTGCP